MAFAVRLIPWKYLGFLVGILVAEIIGLFFLNFYTNNLQNQLNASTNKIAINQEELQTLLEENETLKVLYHYLALKAVLENRILVGDILTSFSQTLPLGVILDGLEINTEKRALKISGSFPNWQLYVQTAAFFKNHSQFKLIDQGAPVWKDEKVKFEWTFNLQ